MSQADPPPTDGQCVADVLAGESERFSVVVARYEQQLLQSAYSRLGSRELAEEAVQETFLCAYRWLASYNSQFSFRTWLWTILLNQCRQRYSKQRKRPPTAGTTSAQLRQQASGEASPAELLLKKEQSERLADLLEQLPEPQADALRLRFYGSLKFQEIADCVDCSLSGAKNRVRLGLEKLSALIRQQELSSHAAAPGPARRSPLASPMLETSLPSQRKEKPQ